MLTKVFNRKVIGALAVDIVTAPNRLHRHIVEFWKIQNISEWGQSRDLSAHVTAIPFHVCIGGINAAVGLGASLFFIDNYTAANMAVISLGSHFLLAAPAMKVFDKINRAMYKTIFNDSSYKEPVAFPAVNEALQKLEP